MAEEEYKAIQPLAEEVLRIVLNYLGDREGNYRNLVRGALGDSFNDAAKEMAKRLREQYGDEVLSEIVKAGKLTESPNYGDKIIGLARLYRIANKTLPTDTKRNLIEATKYVLEKIKGKEEEKEKERSSGKSLFITVPFLLGFLILFHYVDFSTQGMFLATGPAQISYIIIACMLLVVLFYYLFKKK
jgi:hypothetical protein